MKQWRPKSWSQQARELCDYQIEMIEAGWTTVEKAQKFFGESYRHSLITGRAAKRFGRKLRAGKIKTP